MSISENIQRITNSLGDTATLVAVSKTKPVEDLMEAYEAGLRIFGENKIQEMTAKWEVMPKDIQWHMIGHIQTNKVKYMAPYVSLVHAVDSEKLLKEINKQALKNDRSIKVLLQIKIAEEESKFGMTAQAARELLNSDLLLSLNNVAIHGLMGMATFTDDQKQLSREFSYLKNEFDQMQIDFPHLSILSMGMSGDYPLAIEHGSNMVRVGSAIFGARNYS